MQMTLARETDVIDEDEEATIPRSERPIIGEELMLGRAKGLKLSTIGILPCKISYSVNV